MTVGKGKRPRDPNQLAKWIVEQSTEEAKPETPAPDPSVLSAYMASMGRKGGLVGGKRRLVTMTPTARKRAASKAAQARWGKKKAE
jgi:hypothetical protein